MAEKDFGTKMGGLFVTPNELRDQHVIILKRIDEVENLVKATLAGVKQLFANGQGDVTPELEAAVRAVSKISIHIDRKVPDKNVPPGTQPQG